MALTTYANSDNSVLSTGTNLFYVTTNTTGVFKFKFYFRITYAIDSSNNKVITLTQSKNQEGVGILDLSQLFHQMVTPQITTFRKEDLNGFANAIDKSIHDLPVTYATYQQIFSRPTLEKAIGIEAFRGLANKVQIEVYEYYSNTADGAPQLQGFASTKNMYVQWGRGERNDGVYFDWSDYNLDGNKKRFLTGNYRLDLFKKPFIEIERDDLMTMAFRIGHTTNQTDVKRIVFEFLDSNDNTIGGLYLENASLSGGVYVSGGYSTSESTFLFVGCGLEQLNELDMSSPMYTGQKPSQVTGGTSAIKKYKMYAWDSSQTRISEEYTFIVNNLADFCRYEKVRIAWMNKFGCWEYYNFKKVNIDSYKVKRESINKSKYISSDAPVELTGDALNRAYPTGVAHQGIMNWSTQVEDKLTVFTDYLSKGELLMMQDLIMSPQVHLLDGNNAIALICETNDVKVKERGQNKQYTYELKFKYAEPKYRPV